MTKNSLAKTDKLVFKTNKLKQQYCFSGIMIKVTLMQI